MEGLITQLSLRVLKCKNAQKISKKMRTFMSIKAQNAYVLADSCVNVS